MPKISERKKLLSDIEYQNDEKESQKIETLLQLRFGIESHRFISLEVCGIFESDFFIFFSLLIKNHNFSKTSVKKSTGSCYFFFLWFWLNFRNN